MHQTSHPTRKAWGSLFKVMHKPLVTPAAKRATTICIFFRRVQLTNARRGRKTDGNAGLFWSHRAASCLLVVTPVSSRLVPPVHPRSVDCRNSLLTRLPRGRAWSYVGTCFIDAGVMLLLATHVLTHTYAVFSHTARVANLWHVPRPSLARDQGWQSPKGFHSGLSCIFGGGPNPCMS